MPDAVLRFAPLLGRGYLHLVGRTSRFRLRGEGLVEGARGGGPLLWAFWHNRLLGPLYPHRGRNAGVMISRSRDGEIVSRIASGFGYVPLRGSSTRAGGLALKATLRHVRSGSDVAITPDGPRGPRYLVQPGIAYAARRTGAPIVPVGVGFSRKVVFSSWDRFQVPLPFGTIQLVYGEPLRFTDEDDEANAEALRSSLLLVTEEADSLLGVSSP
jgi:lysophospholipid acyltransferase (LPLAT)-like uncharacterized protein